MERSEEIELINRASTGDRMAAQSLIQTLSPPLYRMAYRVLGDSSEAEDMVQECFMRLWPKLKSWRSDARLSTWLHRVMLNQCIDHKRKFRPTPSEILEETLGHGDTVHDVLEKKQAWQAVSKALAQLPARQATALSLCVIEGHSQQEAASLMNVGERALESLLARGRRSLKTLLSNEYRNETSYGE